MTLSKTLKEKTKPYKILVGMVWTTFDDIQGGMPVEWTPKTLSDELLFGISLRGMSVFSSRPNHISYSKMPATIPFPEHELFSICTVLYETSETNRGGFSINLVSILIPQVVMEMAWIDLRQIQAIFSKYFEYYEGDPIHHKKALIKEIAHETDLILKRKLKVINEGEKIREHLTKYLDSYLVSSLTLDEQKLIHTRVITLMRLLDRVLEAGDNERIQRALDRMNFILEQELSDELVVMYQHTISDLVQP
ncbi:MAG: hypothetical protein JSW11_13910 [Candidatus Heimdallarchaeota archaeon]|nr:MAG: hypothetical protein JSW11_13910 [Candidatus Heimdallarchaeota archaeon]